MHKISFAEMRCSLARSLDRIGDWWTLLIIRDLYLGVCRFDEIAEDLGISRNLLTARLARLVETRIVVRVPYSHSPLRHEYRLAEAGTDLIPVILALTAWGDRWVQPSEGQPIRFRHEKCGCALEAVVTCVSCGGTVAAEDVSAHPGPGGAALAGTRVVARRLARPSR
jgi:DNA-binding HxlR family transcriptional regulator